MQPTSTNVATTKNDVTNNNDRITKNDVTNINDRITKNDTSNTNHKSDTKEIIQKLEQDGYKKVQEIHKIVDTNDAIKSITSFISDKCNEFEQKNGRKMTYSEMRAEYG
jgi:hypothetical protein